MKRSLLFAFILFFNASVFAVLPFAVDGEKLPSLAPMLIQVMPSVVNISTKGKQRVEEPAINDPQAQRLFKQPRTEKKVTNSLGSGVIVDASRGYIITNSHVINGAFEITVTLKDGRELYAEVIGHDPETDVAIIKIRPGNLQQLTFADSSQLQVGDFVVAIGNPFGLGQTVTSGIVSALGRSGLGIESYEDFIQTDASINLGSSGGALVNLNGELVGINTAILGSGSNNKGNIGIAFAIPINLVDDIMRQIIDYGEVKRGHLGIQTQNLSSQLAEALNISRKQHGVVITQVEIGASAFEAGLKIADVIVQANGKQIKKIEDVHNLVGLLHIDQQVRFKILRQGKPMAVSIKIQDMEWPILSGQILNRHLYGVAFMELRKLDFRYGELTQILVKSVKKGSQAWLLGFREGDEIVGVNRKRLTGLDDLKKIFRQSKKGVLMSILRGNQAFHVQLK